MKVQPFAVKAGSFELYEAFKKTAEKLGCIYLHRFTAFNETHMARTSCLYFANNWNSKYGGGENTPGFAFSNSGNANVFHLPQQWDEALEQVHDMMYNSCKHKASILHEYVSLEEIAEWKGVPVERIMICFTKKHDLYDKK